ncbi:unnamed protein product [Closterium sp. Yama58-4]|nr:unnamed protein product [Closterium sp. Yama58-4]
MSQNVNFPRDLGSAALATTYPLLPAFQQTNSTFSVCLQHIYRPFARSRSSSVSRPLPTMLVSLCSVSHSPLLCTLELSRASLRTALAHSRCSASHTFHPSRPSSPAPFRPLLPRKSSSNLPLRRHSPAMQVVRSQAGDATVVVRPSLPSLQEFLMESLATPAGDGGGKGASEGGVDSDLVLLLLTLHDAMKRIAVTVSRLNIETAMGARLSGVSGSKNESGDAQKPLDIVSNDIIKATLAASRLVSVAASEEDNDVAQLTAGAPYAAVFDPLDGSRNIDAGIPTGTIWGLYRSPPPATAAAADASAAVSSAAAAVLQPGRALVASGYVLYSSAVVAVLSVGRGTHAFTLDESTGEWLLTARDMRIPTRGQIYSVNDARYFDWPAGLRRYIDAIRQGKGQSGKKYSARYICSLVGDFHRTLLYGGVAMNPRSHLRLLYEANPLAFLAEQAGGKGSDGVRRILDIEPSGKLHERLPLFLGSPEDIDELVGYGDVQQVVNPGYEV